MTPPTLADIHRRIDSLAASSQSHAVVFLKAVCECDGVIDDLVYSTIEEALYAFSKTHRLTLDEKSSIIFIDDVPRDSLPPSNMLTDTGLDTPEDMAEAAIIGYTLEF